MSRNNREALLDVREWSEDPRGSPGVVRRPPGCPGVVGRPSRISGSGREALPDIRDLSGSLRGCLGVIGRPSQMSGSGRESLGDVREWS